MAVTEHVPGLDIVSASDTGASPFGSIKSLAQHVRTWLSCCCAYRASAAMYEKLSKLSNAELHRRGLSRDTLARDVFQSCHRRAEL